MNDARAVPEAVVVPLARTAAAQLLAAVPTPAVIHRRGIVLKANTAAVGLFSFSGEEAMQGFKLFGSLSPSALEAFTARRHAEHAQCALGENSSWARFQLADAHGHPLSMAFTCAQVPYEGEEAVLSFFMDETPGLPFDTALRHSRDVAVVFTDERGRVVWANPASEALSGYSVTEMAGRKPGEVLQTPRTDPAEVARLSRHLRAGSAVVCELLNRHKNGQEYWVRLQVLPARTREGRLLGYVGLQTDVTAEVRRRRSQEQARDQLIATFSHELRTPLNALVNLLDLLQHSPLNPQQAQWLQHGIEASGALRDLVHTVLESSRNQHFEQRRAPSRVRVQDVIRQLGVLAAGYRRPGAVQVHFNCPPELPPVLLRGDLLLRVLMNLLSNALKYTAEGSVTVRVEWDKADRDELTQTLRFSVTDTGIGIPEDQQQRILQPYETLKSSATLPVESTGLGLALCEQMLQHLGSRLAVYSVPGIGSCFSFELLCRSAPTPQAAETARLAPRLDGLRVLVVDDDPVNRLVAQAQLQRLGAAVQTCAEAGSALETLRRFGPGHWHAVLMDLQMPGIDGIEATRLMLREHGFEQQPIFALSGEVEPEVVEQALRAGMQGFIEKPFDAAALAARLQDVAAANSGESAHAVTPPSRADIPPHGARQA